MTSPPKRAAFTLDQTSQTTWDVVAEGSAMVAGTITKTGQIYDASDAQNLPHGTYPTLEKAFASFTESQTP